MSNVETKTLCIALAKADSEEEVLSLLKKAKYWDNRLVWQEYGHDEMNFSTIGNQQSSPDAALVEKLVNSIDAVLLRECLRRGIDPKSKAAPQSIGQAVKDFFDVADGRLSSADERVRSELAKNILLIATGQKSNPSYTIVDQGEGQSPEKIPDTFLSLHRANKVKIPFVQGKFNMGSTGALQFCGGEHNLQLIISKRNPEIAKLEKDRTADKWGFTIIRREPPLEGMRSSTYKYLAPDNRVLQFDAEALPILPKKDYPVAYGDRLESGSFVKMYEYQLPGYKTLINFDLYNRLSLLMPTMALPIRMIERRPGYKGHSYESTLSGMSVRLEEDKRENLEEGFPSSAEINVSGQEMKAFIYAFKKGQMEKYSKKDGIIFTINGQTHGTLSKSFFERKSVGMSYLADSILLIVDCSKIDGRIREDLFLNSRDRMRSTAFSAEIQNQLEEIIKNHPGLRELRERRRQAEIGEKLLDSKPLADVIENIIRKSPSLSKLLLQGLKIPNPFRLAKVSTAGKYVGKRFPTFFRLAKDFPKEKPKPCPLNRGFRVQFETDAENDYFSRDNEPADFKVSLGETQIKNFSLNLWNGLATLTVDLPDEVKVRDTLWFRTEVVDTYRAEPYTNEFFVLVQKAEEYKKGKGGKSKKPPGPDDDGEARQKPTDLGLPDIFPLQKNEWLERGYPEDGALIVKDKGDGGYDFFVYMDNPHLLMELKSNTKLEPQILEARFKFGMALIGMALLHDHETRNKTESNASVTPTQESPISRMIEDVTRSMAPFLLPMISNLGDLEL